MEKSKIAKDNNEPYIASVYRRAHKLALEGKHREINRLFYIANELIKNRGDASNIVDEDVPKIKRNIQTRSMGAVQHNVLRKKVTLDDFIENYVGSIRHKKQLLLSFLLTMYRAGMRYNTNTKKWYLPHP